MDKLTSFSVWALGTILSRVGHQSFFLSGHLNVAKELGAQLSPSASVFLPSSSQFATATTRWQQYQDLNITVVVEVATEKDVQQTVSGMLLSFLSLKSDLKLSKILYANQHSIPFLAVTGGHGAIDSLGSVQHGIQIWMRSMNHIQIAPNGATATIGGGVISKEVTDALWAAGKQAGKQAGELTYPEHLKAAFGGSLAIVTGVCECMSMLGPLLGGGHGWLQGRYGLVADNLIEAQMVLSNGTAVIVSSTSNPDLYCAIRGAGHNFGIITEFKHKIYDAPNINWTYESFIFTRDKIGLLYDQINKMANNGTQPAGLINWSMFIRMPAVDPTNVRSSNTQV